MAQSILYPLLQKQCLCICVCPYRPSGQKYVFDNCLNTLCIHFSLRKALYYFSYEYLVNSKYFPAFFGSLFPAGFGSQKPAFHTRFLFPGIAPRVFIYVTEMEVLHLPGQNFLQTSIQAHLILYHTVAFFPITLVALPLTSLQTIPAVLPQIALR